MCPASATWAPDTGSCTLRLRWCLQRWPAIGLWADATGAPAWDLSLQGPEPGCGPTVSFHADLGPAEHQGNRHDWDHQVGRQDVRLGSAGAADARGRVASAC